MRTLLDGAYDTDLLPRLPDLAGVAREGRAMTIRVVQPPSAAWRTARNRATGQYAVSRLDTVCACCGHTLGWHTAERVGSLQPCLHDQHGASPCRCESFEKAGP